MIFFDSNPNVIVPTEPYKFGSGPNKGRYVEEMMFIDPAKILIMYEKMCSVHIKSEKNRLHKHLDWLIAQSQKMQATAICPHCQENPVKYFRINWYYIGMVKHESVACESCKIMLMHTPEENKIREISFEAVSRLDNRQNNGAYQNGLDILFWSYGLKTGVTPQQLFELFKKA